MGKRNIIKLVYIFRLLHSSYLEMLVEMGRLAS